MFGLGKSKTGTFLIFSNSNFIIYFFSYIKFVSNYNIFISDNYLFFSLYQSRIYIRDNTNKDPKEVVIDEFIGQSIPIYVWDFAWNRKTHDEAIIFYSACFILFRFFNIVKPFL